MGADSKIEWCDHTFNPWRGCTAVSPACDHCYAKTLVEGRLSGDFSQRVRSAASTWKQPLAWNRKAEKLGVRYRVFCASLADVFDNQVPEEWRADLWALIRVTPHLDWLLLTKRPQNIAKMLPPDWGDGWHNVWLGTTVENQAEADRRIPHLLEVPARVRFLSCEPLLGPVRLVLRGLPGWDEDWKLCALTGQEWAGRGFDEDAPPVEPRIHWVICGGESGPGARPMHPDWARSLRDQCDAAGVPFFFKQHGEFREFDTGSPVVDVIETDDEFSTTIHPKDMGAIKPAFVALDGRSFINFADVPEDLPVRLIERVGKKAAGRLLDGRTWDQFPEARS